MDENKIVLNLTDKIREKIKDLMEMDDLNEVDAVLGAVDYVHKNKYAPYKKMLDIKEEKDSVGKTSNKEKDNPFNFERNVVSNEAYLATLEDEMREYKNRGDTEMIFLTKEKIDKVKDKIKGIL